MVLSQVASVYDPLGMVTPYICPTFWLENFCIDKDNDWDTLLSVEDGENWITFYTEMCELEQLSIYDIFIHGLSLETQH